jgi:hypothetical protein
VISAAVMSHPSRVDMATRLADALTRWRTRVVPDPDPEGPPSALRAARAAWAAIRPGATHHVVLQDDVALCHGFADMVVAAVRQHPDRPLALYANWNSWNGAATRAAALRNARWVPAVPGEWVPTLALVLPRPDVEALLSAVPDDAPAAEPDDEVLVRELARRGRRVLLAVPHLVEHIGRTSLVGNDTYGPRHSALFADAVGIETSGEPEPEPARLPDVIVHMLRGQVHVVLTAPSPPRWQPLRTYLDETGLRERAEAGWHARPAVRLPADAAAMSRQAWYAGYLLGRHTPPVAPPPPGPVVRACLRTLVLGGNSDRPERRRPATRHLAALTDLAEDGLRAGLLHRRRDGPAPSYPRERLAALPPATAIWTSPELLAQPGIGGAP